MKKLILSFLLLAFCLSAFPQKRNSDSLQVVNIQYNLSKYHSERQTGYMLFGLSVLTGVVSASYVNYPNSNLSRTTLLASAGLGLIGTIVFMDSEKWLKRASVRIGPGGLRINF